MNDHQTLGLDAVMDDISRERVIYIGEIHGTSSIHLLQLEIITRLRQGGKNLVIALEAFPFSKQAILDRWTKGSLDRYDFERAYGEVWNIPFEYYEGIFDFAKEQRIPLIAMNAEDEMILAVSKKGLEAVHGDFLRMIKFTDCSTDIAYKRMLTNRYHSAEFPFFCEGQRLRDSVMAFNITKALNREDYTVVVLAGIAHASKVAVPGMVQRQTGAAYKVLLPGEVRHLINRSPDRDIADYIWY